jgi:PAS domain S-box-containing protein
LFGSRHYRVFLKYKPYKIRHLPLCFFMQVIYQKNCFICVVLLFALGFSAYPTSVKNKTELDSLLKTLPLSKTEANIKFLLELSTQYLSFSADSSRKYAVMALNNAKELKDSALLAESYKTLGNVFYYQEKNNEVISYYDSSLQIYSILNDSSGMAKVWNNLGIIYQNIGDFEKSMDYHFKSLIYKESINDSLGIISSYNNIGSIYYDLGEFSKSEECFKKSLDLSIKSGNYKFIQSILNNLGLINQELKNYQRSIEYLNKSIIACEKNNDQNGKANAYHNLGKSYYLLKEFQKALDNYFNALKIYNCIGIENSQTLNNIGQVYIELDYPQQALEHLSKALKIAKKNNQFTQLRDIYNNLSVVYEHLGKYENAYFNYILYNEYDDSIKNQMYSNRIENIYDQANLDKKQKELENLNLETQLILEKKDSTIRSRNYLIYSFIAGIISIIAISMVLLNMFRHKTKAHRLLKRQNEEIIKSDQIIKKINKALTQNEEMLRSIFDASPSSIIVISPDFEILDCNNTSLTMFAATNKCDFINKKIDHLFIPDQLKVAKENIKKAFENEHVEKIEFSLAREDGSTFNAEITGGLIKDPSEKFAAYVMIITDITERQHFIENLKQAKLEAEESDRLKTAFLANMSHEIRTPMNSIIGFSNLLNEPELKQEKKEEYIQHILQSSNSLLNLIDDIIDISKIEAGQININPVNCNVNRLVKDLFNSYIETAKSEGVKLSLVLPPDSDFFNLKTDPYRLKQILSNLLGNALKFTDKGFIELGYTIRKTDSKKSIEFYVKDTGIGIPKEKQNIIFDRFRQVDDSRTRRFGGTGLGLAISKRLVDLLGGSIWVESEFEKGSTFFFSLPYENGEHEEVIQVEPFNAFRYDWKGKTILIAEDENSNFELLKASINRTKIKIIRAMNGEEAVEHVKKNNKINLVLMDIRMPKLNGYDATRQIKVLNPKLPVISITAYAMSEDETKSIDAGCDMYISKPIRPLNLLTVLNEFLGSE